VHEARRGAGVSALPLLSPDLWIWARGRPSAVRARFEIRARAPGGPGVVLWSEELAAAPPPPEAFASLDAFAERPVELSFCAGISHGPGLATPGAWAEPAIVRVR